MKKIKEFWSKYSVNIVRFWSNQVVMSILGISVGLATIALDNLAVSVIGCIFTIGLLCFLQYDNLFQLGVKFHFRPEGDTRPHGSVGFKIGVFGSVPLFLLIVLGLIFQIALRGEGAATVCKFIYYAIHGSYIQLHAFLTTYGVLTADSLAMQCLGWGFYFLYTIPVILSCTVGFVLGLADRPIRTFFGLRHPNQKKKAGK